MEDKHNRTYSNFIDSLISNNFVNAKEKERVTGIITKNNKIINSKIIICNADPPFVYKNLLDEKQHNFLFKTKRNRYFK